ncbi:hypothetical protein KKA24_01360 [Patescibacteria group bacterium]|nr:hypothetical protein [Patescibacteria group bacterium]
MINQEVLKEAEDIIRKFFNMSGFDLELKILPLEEKTIPVKIIVDDPKTLIGQNGQTLADMQHLLKAILSHKIAEQFYIDLDINNYKEKKISYLKESAREWANEVALSGQEKVLSPMPNFERRIVHLELINRSDVVTESAGYGPDRCVVIKPR